jgi:hypothetical protein
MIHLIYLGVWIYMWNYYEYCYYIYLLEGGYIIDIIMG